MPPPRIPAEAGGKLVIGLVNMMPKATPAAALQFRRLLPPGSVELRVFAPGSAGGHDHDGIEALWDTRLDGIIVTGCEPQAACMSQEPAWPLLQTLADWAAEHVTSAVWSCFAAHAAVYRLDGLQRQPLAGKLSGVFACQKRTNHPMLAAMPEHWLVPHSRRNFLPEAALRDAGYTILSGGPAAGVDSFLKPYGRSLFLFLQGHPEYGAATLRDEYRRDLQRFAAGHLSEPPQPPVGAAALATSAVPVWETSARAFYAGWLNTIRTRQAQFQQAQTQQALPWI